MSYNTKCLNANNSSTATSNATSTAFDVSEASLYGGAGGVDEKPPAPPVRLASAPPVTSRWTCGHCRRRPRRTRRR
ncbi:hypothetical protein TYRP_020638 [Tyrophagus putrescentiae]|nr:hypothetical protein TYRP_020638 [Tyrophagus putrescentiae]